MVQNKFFSAGAVAVCLLLATALFSANNSAIASGVGLIQEKQPNVSDAENEALKKIDDSKEPAAKIQAGAEFIKKYPKSEVRRKVAEHVVASIVGVADAPKRITLAESYLATFTGAGEADLMTPALLDAYITAGRAVEAFKISEAWLPKNPDEVDMFRRLAVTAGNEAIKGNSVYVKTGLDYGTRATALMEADKRPASIAAAKWAEYKTTNLSATYREVGILAMRAGDHAAARQNMEKAVALKSKDPIVYILLSDLANRDYNQSAAQYQTMPEGDAKKTALKTVEEKLDRVIALYAQTVAISEGNERYGAAAQQLKNDLTNFYKFRHGGSTDGLEELINKHRKALP